MRELPCVSDSAGSHTTEVSPATQAKFGLQVAARKLAQGVQMPGTELVWTDGAWWSGYAVSCESISAGPVRLRNHAIGTQNAEGDTASSLEAGPQG